MQIKSVAHRSTSKCSHKTQMHTFSKKIILYFGRNFFFQPSNMHIDDPIMHIHKIQIAMNHFRQRAVATFFYDD